MSERQLNNDEKHLLSILSMMKGQEMTVVEQTFYLRFFDQVGVAAARDAVLWAADNLTWRPSAAELRRHLLELLAPAPSTAEAVAEVFHLIRSNGASRPPVPSHPWIGVAIESLGGWRTLCEEFSATRLQTAFAAAYKEIVESFRRQALSELALPPRERTPLLFPENYRNFLLSRPQKALPDAER